VAGESTVCFCALQLLCLHTIAHMLHVQSRRNLPWFFYALFSICLLSVVLGWRIGCNGKTFMPLWLLLNRTIVEVQVPWRFRHECSHWKAWKNNIMYTVMNWAQNFQNTGSVCDHCESRSKWSVHTPEAINGVREVMIQCLLTPPDVSLLHWKFWAHVCTVLCMMP